MERRGVPFLFRTMQLPIGKVSWMLKNSLRGTHGVSCGSLRRLREGPTDSSSAPGHPLVKSGTGPPSSFRQTRPCPGAPRPFRPRASPRERHPARDSPRPRRPSGPSSRPARMRRQRAKARAWRAERAGRRRRCGGMGVRAGSLRADHGMRHSRLQRRHLVLIRRAFPLNHADKKSTRVLVVGKEAQAAQA